MALPDRADVVIVGGGIVGASIAYHLAELGTLDVCLVERGQLTCGTTWHAAGLVAELRASPNLTRLARYSAELYESLGSAGEPTGFRRVGALTLACQPERVRELKRQAAMARQNQVACNWLEPPELAERWPDIDLSGVLGAVHMPRDGQTSPVDTTRALANQARRNGARVIEGVAVTRIEVASGKVFGVVTAEGRIPCDRVIVCAGLWSRALAADAGAILPLYPAEHFYAVSEPLDAAGRLPIVRSPDQGIYLKPDAGRLLVGCFESTAKPLAPESLPDDFAFEELPFDLEHFAPYLQNAIDRLPALGETGIRTWFNGPESFTPDGRYIVGPLSEIRGLFAACGMNSIGIQSAGGIGQVMARWVAEGRPPMDLWEVDARRFLPFQNETGYLVERTSEALGLLYAMHWPYRQHESARLVRRSPLHERLAAAGACFGELAGWERANWYARPDQAPAYEYSYGRQNWFANAAQEHRATREAVAVFDQSSFAKYEITGPDACRLLNHLSTSDLDVAVGRVVYCQWLNERGGIEADVTVTRLGPDTFWVVSAAPCQRRDLAWLAEHRTGFDAEVRDITEQHAVIGVMGPHSRRLLQSLTDADLSHQAFPFATSRPIAIANTALRATRITYVGALGWELYVPWADAPAVYDAVAGARPTHAGYHAMDSLRIEKGYRHWGHDISDEDTPIEAGLSFTAAWDKPAGFIGREALLKQKADGVSKRLALFALEDPDALLYHDEPIWWNGRPAGRITSGAYGHSLGRAMGFGYIVADQPFPRRSLTEGRFTIEIEDTMVEAVCHLRAPFDADNRQIIC
ncbi:MAG: FAD-dependent oxidoreductase [Pseudomonadales bacterium]|nr:FAD-dependent oxidoreductase [Pseudomonadales bacterium]NIX09500.1 FAD-dependent oxidoreductase [Pseudomonadales bacterium]